MLHDIKEGVCTTFSCAGLLDGWALGCRPWAMYVVDEPGFEDGEPPLLTVSSGLFIEGECSRVCIDLYEEPVCAIEYRNESCAVFVNNVPDSRLVSGHVCACHEV